jgi:hypothetical protein
MTQLEFATDNPAASHGQTVVPFDWRRRRAAYLSAAVGRSSLSEGVVVRLALANRETRWRGSHAGGSITRAKSLDGNEQRFTPFDFVATAFLILSVFAAPALVWTLLRSASLG